MRRSLDDRARRADAGASLLERASAPSRPVRRTRGDGRAGVASHEREQRRDRASARLSELGQAIVETALMLPILVILLVGIFDLGRAVWLSNTLATAVREGSRYGVVHGAQSGSPTGPGSGTYTPPNIDTAITTVVQKYAIGVPSMTVNATWPDGNANRGSRIVVSASFPFTPLLSQAFIGQALRVTMQSSSTLVIEQ